MKILQFIILTLFSFHGLAEVLVIPADSTSPKPLPSLWKKDFQIGANLNQSSFSNNWKAGGSNTFAGGWFLLHSAKFENAGWRLNSDLNMQLGFLQNKTQSIRKNVDRIFYEFKAGYRITHKWDFYGSTNFQTQFLNGYEYGKKNILGVPVDSLVSSLFAPAYLTTSLGFEVHPNKNFFSRFGVGSLRQTFVLDKQISNAGLYGLEKPGDNIRNQFVLQVIFNIDRDIFENINLKARYSGLFDYFRLDYPGTYVHRFDTTISMKVNKFVNANLQAVLLRDRDQDPKWQFSQSISLGFLYRIVN